MTETPDIKKKNWLRRIAIAIVTLPTLGLALWIWGALNFSYSSGERVGFVQKLSHRGWLCKTYEGELAMVNIPGQPAEKFPFTVRDSKIAKEIESYSGDKVVIHYQQHIGLPTSCFGDTTYFVDSVRSVQEH